MPALRAQRLICKDVKQQDNPANANKCADRHNQNGNDYFSHRLHSSFTALVLRGFLQTLLTDLYLALYINSATVGGFGGVKQTAIATNKTIQLIIFID